jgi:hypothetical protein
MAEYDPDLIAAIRAARADLYAAQAERRRTYLLTGVWAGKTKAPTDVQTARANLDAARALAQATATE